MWKISLSLVLAWSGFFLATTLQASRPMMPTTLRCVLAAEGAASGPAQKILEAGRELTLTQRRVLPGACWDYANAVYEHAGFDATRRKAVFKGRFHGPFADVSLIKEGDWLSYVNHSYGDVEHSAIFVAWLDYKAKQGLMLSYAGEHRSVPARYLSYDLSNVYRIVRPAP